ncbi:MAG TPA: nucleotide-binding protein [Allosphingosinicella sp.]|jgi:predicted nucleotide-binding protein
MAGRKQGNAGADKAPALLRAPRPAAKQQIESRIEIGKGLLGAQIASAGALKEARAAYYSWSEYNTDLLRRLFSTSEYADEYSSYIGFGIIGQTSLSEDIAEHFDDIKLKLRRLSSILERLDLVDEDSSVAAQRARPALSQPRPRSGAETRKIFVVHGRDEEMKQTVARLLARLDFEPVILSEQPNGGRTIIEKFEQEADVRFAVVLLSPDDEGRLKGAESQLQDRARQNVVLELGYFVGKLGRGNVCALKRGDLELPSDIVGVAYTSFEAGEAWKLSLAQELRAAGLEVDFNRL